MTRILLVNNQVRDFLKHRLVFARKLREAGFEVHVAVPREPSMERILRKGFPVHGFFVERLSLRLLDELRCCASLVELYRQLQPRLVHHISLKPALYGGLAARIAGVPAALSTLTGLGHLFTSRAAKLHVLRKVVAYGLRLSLSHRNHLVIFQNPDDRDRLLEMGIRRDQAILLKGSGVDLSLFTHQPESDGPPVVLMASRLLWDKGVGEFVAAAAALRSRGVRVRFLLAGEPDLGHPSAIPLSTLHSWRKSGVIEWLGWRNDMAAILSKSHIVCLPSYYGEGVPRILLEAAASGRPVVTTDSSGCREAVRDGDNGLLVPARDSRALRRAIRTLVDDARLRVVMGRRGREIALAEFSQEMIIDANIALYRLLLDGNSCARAPSISSRRAILTRPYLVQESRHADFDRVTIPNSLGSGIGKSSPNRSISGEHGQCIRDRV